MEMPMCISGSYGHAQVFLLKGETPMLCSRPIIEALGVIMDFQQRLVCLNNGLPGATSIVGLVGGFGIALGGVLGAATAAALGGVLGAACPLAFFTADLIASATSSSVAPPAATLFLVN